MRVGVVGVGAIGAAMVESVLTGPDADAIDIVLSPRSSERVSVLAQRFPSVQVAAGNQDVVDRSDIVIIAVLPGQVREVCADLTFREDQVVVGLAAGWPPSRLAGEVAPAARVCQLIPLPMIALHTGPIVLYPPEPSVQALLRGCGELVVLDREEQIIVLSCASATMSAYFTFLHTTIDWAASQGLPGETAKDYLSALFLGLATEAVATPSGRIADLAREHETPGGLNEQIRTALTAAGTFEELRAQLSAMLRDRMH